MVLNITIENFEKSVLNSEIPVLVDFWAPWCGPCKMMGPTIEELAAEVKDVKIAKVNIDENPELAHKYGIMSIPTLVLFKDGKAVNTKVGLQPKAGILQMMGK